ncbi:SpoIIE family protein phosphatase [bacterium]|nr:SpoIIE family protein phosphatase [bacterium]
MLSPHITDRTWLNTLCTRLSHSLGWEVSFHDARDDDGSAVPRSHVVWQHPVHAGDVLAGHLQLQSATEVSATAAPQIVETATLFAEVLGRLVSLETLLQERERHAQSFDELGQWDQTPSTLPELVQRCLNAAMQMCQAWGAAFFLVDLSQDALQLRMAEMLTAGTIPQHRRMRLSSPDGHAMAQGLTVLLAEELESRDWLPTGCHTAAVIPVNTSAGCLGTLWIYERRQRRWSKPELQNLKLVAGQLAAGLERVVLLRERDARKKELTYASNHHRVSAVGPTLADSGLEVAVRSRSPDPLGGDLCEVWPIDDRYTLLAIGDAAGHSVPAAMTMSVVRGSLRTLLGASADEVVAVERLANQINRALHSVTQGEQFMTMICAVYDAVSQRLTFANCGHPAFWLIRGTQIQEIKSHGLMLGVLPDATHDRFQTALQPGDQLVFFTDGILEAMSPQREMFGHAGVMRALTLRRFSSPEETAEAVWAELDRHVGGQSPRDDQTLLVAGVKSRHPRFTAAS